MASDAEILSAFGRLPRVSDILEAVGLLVDYSRVPRHLLEHARQRGTALHAAIALYHEDDLDAEALHPEVAPGFSAYLKFLGDSAFTFQAGEFEVVHPTWLYCGHPDLLGTLNSARILIDLKYMDIVHLHAATYQLTLYKLAWEAQFPEEPIVGCFVLQLKKDGTYRLHPVPTGLKEAQVALAAVTVFRAIEESRR